MSNHTPGPWRTFNGTDIFPDDDDINGTRHIADCHPEEGVPNNVSYEQRLANAHLIAAAPDMFRVLKEIEECAEYWSEYDVPIGIHERINKALMKAEGREQNG